MNLCALAVLIAFSLSVTAALDVHEANDLPYLTWRLAEAVNSFAFRLHHRMSVSDGGNLVFSPLSIANTLGMLHFGAKGRTAKELEQILGYENANITRSVASKAYRYLLTELLVSSKPKQYSFELLSTVFINRPVGVSPTYLRRVEEFYRTPVKQVSFLLDGQRAVHELNEWVQKKTRKRLNHVIAKLDPSAHIVSVSAAYFKAVWRQPFSAERTKPGVFFNEGRLEKSIPMMEGEGAFYYCKNEELSLVELPFKGRNLSAVIILPHEKDGLPRIEQKTTEYEFTRYLELTTQEHVAVTIPKFKIQFTTELSGILKFYGVHQLFDKAGVNLAGMIPRGDVAVGSILHSSVVEVSESGIETTSAKTVAPEHHHAKEIFCADHPFLFGIVDQRNGMLMLMGRVWSL